MKLIALIATLLVGLTGCAGVVGGGSRSWKEQVILPDGSEVIVERTNILGSKLDREFSSYNEPPPVDRFVLSIPLQNGEKATWVADRKDMSPIAILLDRQTAYVVAEPFNCDAHRRLGNPIPPFLFFRHEAGNWSRIEYKSLPWSIERANLLMGSGGQLAINMMEKGIISARAIRVANEVAGDRIYSDGADRFRWRGCASVIDRINSF